MERLSMLVGMIDILLTLVLGWVAWETPWSRLWKRPFLSRWSGRFRGQAAILFALFWGGSLATLWVVHVAAEFTGRDDFLREGALYFTSFYAPILQVTAAVSLLMIFSKGRHRGERVGDLFLLLASLSLTIVGHPLLPVPPACFSVSLPLLQLFLLTRGIGPGPQKKS